MGGSLLTSEARHVRGMLCARLEPVGSAVVRGERAACVLVYRVLIQVKIEICFNSLLVQF